MLSSASDKAKLFAKNFLKNSNVDDSRISVPVFPSGTNLKLHNISVTPKIVQKVITNLDSSKSSGRDSSGGSKELWSWNFIHTSWALQYLSESLVFQIVGSSHWWSLYLRMLGQGLLVKTTTLLVFFLWLIKSLKTYKLKIIELLITKRNLGLFSVFWLGFRSSRSTGDHLTVVSDRIARAFNRSGAAEAVALDISKAFEFGMLFSSHIEVLWNFWSDLWPYFFFSQ